VLQCLGNTDSAGAVVRAPRATISALTQVASRTSARMLAILLVFLDIVARYRG
jgi:hypothetical protein